MTAVLPNSEVYVGTTPTNKLYKEGVQRWPTLVEPTALKRIHRTSDQSTANVSPYPTAPFSVEAGELVIAVCQLSIGVGVAPVALGITGHGLTWTLIVSTAWPTTTGDRISAWQAVATATTFDVVNFSTTDTPAGAAWSISTFTGYNPTTPVSGGLTAGSTVASVSINASSLTGQRTFWAAARNGNVVGLAVGGAGSTQICDVGHASPTRNLAVYEEAGENSPSVSWGGANWQQGMIAFKVT